MKTSSTIRVYKTRLTSMAWCADQCLRAALSNFCEMILAKSKPIIKSVAAIIYLEMGMELNDVMSFKK